MGRRTVEFTPYAREAAELMGANVRRKRVALGWTLEELGARAGCTRYTVAAIERGSPLASVLHDQARDQRERSLAALMEEGGRREIAMLLPVVFLILPVTVMFALYPGLIALDFTP